MADEKPTMSRMHAVKQFLSNDTAKPVQTSEFMTFWKACSEVERAEFGNSAAEQIGVTIATTV